MGVVCHIFINKPREPNRFYISGSHISGKVKYVIDKPTKYQNVTLSFCGKAKCQWSRSYGRYTNVTYRNSEKYVNLQVNVTNKNHSESITLHGAYESPFKFFLPRNIPSTYSDSTGSIVYYVKMKFEKPGLFSFNSEFTEVIPVLGMINLPPRGPGPVGYYLEKALFTLSKTKKPKVILKVEMAKICVLPGEDLHVYYEVRNDSSVTIPSVKTDLYCYTTYYAPGDTKKKKKVFCTVHTPSVPVGEVNKMICVVPTLPKMYTIHHSNVISREFRLRATLRLPIPHCNAKLEIPVVIGVPTQTVSASMSMPAPSAPALDQPSPSPPSPSPPSPSPPTPSPPSPSPPSPSPPSPSPPTPSPTTPSPPTPSPTTPPPPPYHLVSH